MPPVVFADNDAILKLSEYDLLYDAWKVLQVTPTEVYVLQTAARVIAHKRRVLTSGSTPQHSDEGIDRALAFVDGAHMLPDAPTPEYFDPLVRVEDIDIGDALLMSAALALTSDPLLLTGDKKCLRALATTSEVSDIHSRLSGRVVCLEEMVRAMILHEDVGFSKVRRGVMNAPSGCDRAISFAFGGCSSSDWERVVSRLEKILDCLEKDVGEGWLRRLA